MRDGGVIENVEDRDSEHDQEAAIPLCQNFSSGVIREPAVEVVSEGRHEQRESVEHAGGWSVEAAALQCENVGEEAVDRVVGEEQAGHEEEDLEEEEELRRLEEAEGGRLLD